MWALRSAAAPLRFRSHRIVSAIAFCTDLDMQYADVMIREDHHEKIACQEPLCFHLSELSIRGLNFSSSSLMWTRKFSSQIGTKSNGKDDDLEEGFSDLGVPLEDGDIGDVEDKEDSELTSEEEADEIELSDIDSDVKTEKEPKKKIFEPPILKVILHAPRQGLSEVLDKWVSEGNSVDRSDYYVAILQLRKRKLFFKALQLAEWLEASKHVELTDRDYVSRLDLVAKVHGLHRAEKFIEKIPESFRTEVTYRTLLANCAAAANVSKAEAVFNKMRDLGFPITAFACNQLLLLYKRVDRKKIADVLLLMEKENVKPNLFTYKLLIDTKGSSKDISGMEQVRDTMIAEGIKPDLLLQATIARHYIFSGHKDKAQAILKEIEGDDIKENRAAWKVLLPLYAFLNKADDVARIWEVCEKPRLDESLAAIEAWGRLGKIENAEKVFEDMFTTWKTLSSKYYNAMLKVYADHKLLSKGKELVQRMSENGFKVNMVTLDAIVRLYVASGEIEKADSMLQKAVQQNKIKPLYSTYLALLESYAKRGDIHSAEKIFGKLRTIGYTGRMRQFQLLLQAYQNAKAPAYGFRERMKADNIFPNKALAGQLAAVDAFRRTPISDLLD